MRNVVDGRNIDIMDYVIRPTLFCGAKYPFFVLNKFIQRPDMPTKVICNEVSKRFIENGFSKFPQYTKLRILLFNDTRKKVQFSDDALLFREGRDRELTSLQIRESKICYSNAIYD